MNTNHIKVLVAQHKKHYIGKEKSLFAKIERFYNGEFFHLNSRASNRGVQFHDDPRSSVNLFFTAVETAKFLLLGQEVAVAANGHTPEAHKLQGRITHLINEVFRENDMRELCGIALDNALTKRRGIFKTIIDPIKKKPKIFTVEPSHVGYDPSAKAHRESRFWTHMVEMPWRLFKKRVEMGVYKRPGKLADPVAPDTTPQWAMLGDQSDQLSVDEVFGIAIVWEIYDMIGMRAYHWHETTGTIIWEGEIDDQPLSMFSLNHNLRNLDGLSELELIIPQQEAINNINTTMHQVIHRILPRIMVDSGIVDMGDLAKAYHAPAGSYTPVRMTSPQGAPLAQAFMPTPTANLDPQLIRAREIMIGDAQFVSGLTSQSRGAAQNIRTAREAADISAYARDRVAFREGNFRDAISRVGERCMRLLQKYGQGPYSVKHRDTFSELNQIDLKNFNGHFDIAPYSPIKNNPQLLADVVGKMSNLLMNNPNVNQREFYEIIMEGFGIPSTLYNPEPAGQQAQPGIDQMAEASTQAAEVDPAEGSPNQEQVAQMAQE